MNAILKYTLNGLAVAAIAGFAGYMGSKFSPVQAQFAVVDLAGVAKAAALAGKSAQDVREIGEQLKIAVQHLANENGLVVLDSSAVIAAPQDAYVVIPDAEKQAADALKQLPGLQKQELGK